MGRSNGDDHEVKPGYLAQHMFCSASVLRLGMHVARLHPGLHHCDALNLSSAFQIGAELRQIAGLSETPSHKLRLGHPRSPFGSWLTRAQRQYRALGPVHQSLPQPEKCQRSGKAGRGQVGPSSGLTQTNN